MVEDPSGIVLRVDLGDSRSTNLTITKPGNYQFSLIRDGETVSHTSLISSSIPSLAPSTPQPQSDVIPTPIKTSTSGNLSWIIIPILLLIIIFVGFFFFRSKKRK